MYGHLAVLAAGGGAGGGFDPLDPSGWGNAIWTWVIFLVALPLMVRFVFGPIARALDRRDARALEEVRAAATDRKKAASERDEAAGLLERLRAREAEILAAVRAKADQVQREIHEQARADAERHMERARLAIEQERARVESEIRGQMVDVALEVAGKALGRMVDDEDQRRFIQELLDSVGPERSA